MNKIVCTVVLVLCTVSCIEPFQPEIRERQDMLVINGNITDRPGLHYVEISRAAPYNDPGFIPVSGCVVRVEDLNGRGVTYTENEPGIYGAHLEEDFLQINNAYRLNVHTNEGAEYMSEYDSLLRCATIDSLWYEIDLPVSEDPDITFLGGVQFFVDVKGTNEDSRNFLWKFEETFKYYSTYLIQYLWENDSVYEFDPPSDSLAQCFTGGSIPEVYTASSRHLVANELNRYPLYYVLAWGPRLRVEYGLLVSQHSLSDDAFLYWEKMNNLTESEGNLYDKQPANPEGNIYNINDPSEMILGYFYASQVLERWIQLKKPFPVYNLDEPCWLELADLDYLEPGSFLVSVDKDGMGPPFGSSGNNECFDCRLQGGSLEPPVYWQKNE